MPTKLHDFPLDLCLLNLLVNNPVIPFTVLSSCILLTSHAYLPFHTVLRYSTLLFLYSLTVIILNFRYHKRYRKKTFEILMVFIDVILSKQVSFVGGWFFACIEPILIWLISCNESKDWIFPTVHMYINFFITSYKQVVHIIHYCVMDNIDNMDNLPKIIVDMQSRLNVS